MIPRRIREFVGLGALMGLAIGGGMVLDKLQGEAHARWLAMASLLGFLGLTMGVVRWMEVGWSKHP